MSAQLEDFEQHEGVEVVAATSDISYEKILTESSLMVTDYSGVQFDFAYMKKPLVYYHPDVLPPQYEAGGLVYETMGFGPICRNHEDMVDTLCQYMKNKCVMEEEYKNRVDDFFQYSDHDNCSRIYDEVMKFQSKFGKVNKYDYKK
jgi:CDP-glycerol glycerophosphotransferase (TagB/SpsB family)